MVPLKFVVLVFCVVAVSLAMPEDNDIEKSLEKNKKDSISKVLKTLPEEEKSDFLAYFLALGLKDWIESQGRPPKFFPQKKPDAFIKGLNIPEDNVEKFQKMNIPKESRKKLLEWTKSEFNLTTRNVVDLLRTRKCQGPHCVALPDIGEICCPW